MDEPFYKNGLRFSCKECGKCCRISDGIVHLSEIDIERLANSMAIPREEFLHSYTHREHHNRVLNDFPNGDCVFFRDGKGCTVYIARPTQCRTFPFWRSVLVSRDAWDSTSSECPGMNQGRLYTYSEIEEIADGKKDAQD